ncbi:MAG: hypothetical protein E5X86_19715 [Mesorhizobium sp.]|uniref:hypothetical protein n=1 Tax=Mesorhizobium sp. TaxID=1871066 RepID=UPI00122352CA|nr:hypothetical protein [Mesorhizobium sp.]TIO15601.1 MAG: hypothetical protein E5X86_19715 [Mesorhizobium sp.]
MTAWNFDISQAPRGKMVETITETTKGTRKSIRFVPDKLIVATKCGKVTVSEFIPDEGRWLMLGKGEQPDAWMPWPTHPTAVDHSNLQGAA